MRNMNDIGILLKESNLIPDVLDVTEYIDIDDVEKFKEYSGNVILNKVIDCLISDNVIRPDVNKLETI